MNQPDSGTQPPSPPPSGLPPVLNAPPRLPAANKPPASWRGMIAAFLSVFVICFLVDAILSVADDALIGLANVHVLTNLRGLSGLITLLLSLVLYGLMALTPAIPKRFFAPLALFGPVGLILAIPLGIYYFHDYRVVELFGWLMDWLQLMILLVVLRPLTGAFKVRWPLVTEDRLAGRGFTWRNLIGFVLANVFGLFPAMLLYLFLWFSLAVSHFSGGFVALHPGGLTVQARTYVRDDGKTIQLFPMSHVAEADFYKTIAQTFPTNSLILMEGVTDEKKLLTNQISYRRMARSLGLAEQHEVFKPKQGKIIRADIDVDQFSTNTLAMLNLIMLFHTRGVNAAAVQQLLQNSPSPEMQDQLFGDLLGKRNRHLLEQIQEYLPRADCLVIPWGAAHMPGIARGIQEAGFHLKSSRDYTVIRFFH